MPEGGCLCGRIRISFSKEPDLVVLCHCNDCRKISGAVNSYNAIVKQDDFKLESGSPKSYSMIAGSGKTITNFFCGDCGTTIWRDGENFPGVYTLKAGILDDAEWLQKHVPTAEIHTHNRLHWVAAIQGAD